jgi:hypothetical protein
MQSVKENKKLTGAKSWSPGDILHLESGTFVVLSSRKEDDTGWWLKDPDGKPAGGLVDWAAEEIVWRYIPRSMVFQMLQAVTL